MLRFNTSRSPAPTHDQFIMRRNKHTPKTLSYSKHTSKVLMSPVRSRGHKRLAREGCFSLRKGKNEQEHGRERKVSDFAFWMIIAIPFCFPRDRYGLLSCPRLRGWSGNKELKVRISYGIVMEMRKQCV